MATYTMSAVGCVGSQHALTAISFLGGQPSISLVGPTRRTTPENPVPFNCTAGPFNSSDFNVTWMKDRDEHPASAQRLVTDNKGNYSITSKVWVTLSHEDILSEITCEVTHRGLAKPLRRSMNLSLVLQGERAGGWGGGGGVAFSVFCTKPHFTVGKLEFRLTMSDPRVALLKTLVSGARYLGLVLTIPLHDLCAPLEVTEPSCASVSP